MTVQTEQIKYREHWLDEALELLRPLFLEKVGKPLPDDIRVTCGFPAHGALRTRNKVIGQCWVGDELLEDGVPQLFISPLIDDSIEVLGVLVHELIHAYGIIGHRANFRGPALALGLEGKMTATQVGKDLGRELEQIINKIGTYPHTKLKNVAVHDKQGTRMIKCQCDECGYIVRTTRKWLLIAVPECPLGHGVMDIDD